MQTMLASLLLTGTGPNASVSFIDANGKTIAGPAPLVLRFTTEELQELLWLVSTYSTSRQLAELQGGDVHILDRRAAVASRLVPIYGKRLWSALVPQLLTSPVTAFLKNCRGRGSGELGLIIESDDLHRIPWELAIRNDGVTIGRSSSVCLVRRTSPRTSEVYLR